MFDASAVLARLAEHNRNLRGSEVRLLVFLTGNAAKSGSVEVIASVREVAACLHTSPSQIERAKRRLADLGLVLHDATARRGAGSWYLRYLRDLVGVPALGTGVPNLGTAAVPALGTGVPNLGTAAADGHSHDQDGPAHARRSIEAFVTTGSFSSIDRVLTTQKLEPEQTEHAGIVARYLHSWAARDGVPGLNNRKVDEQILAQCMAIGPLGVLESAWLAIIARLNGRKVESWGFFVNALLAQVGGFTPTEVKARRAHLRNQPRLINGVDGTSIANSYVTELSRNAKVLA